MSKPVFDADDEEVLPAVDASNPLDRHPGSQPTRLPSTTSGDRCWARILQLGVGASVLAPATNPPRQYVGCGVHDGFSDRTNPTFRRGARGRRSVVGERLVSRSGVDLDPQRGRGELSGLWGSVILSRWASQGPASTQRLPKPARSGNANPSPIAAHHLVGKAAPRRSWVTAVVCGAAPKCVSRLTRWPW
jgi:hypothetical protein